MVTGPIVHERPAELDVVQATLHRHARQNAQQGQNKPGGPSLPIDAKGKDCPPFGKLLEGGTERMFRFGLGKLAAVRPALSKSTQPVHDNLLVNKVLAHMYATRRAVRGFLRFSKSGEVQQLVRLLKTTHGVVSPTINEKGGAQHVGCPIAGHPHAYRRPTDCLARSLRIILARSPRIILARSRIISARSLLPRNLPLLASNAMDPVRHWATDHVARGIEASKVDLRSVAQLLCTKPLSPTIPLTNNDDTLQVRFRTHVFIFSRKYTRL